MYKESNSTFVATLGGVSRFSPFKTIKTSHQRHNSLFCRLIIGKHVEIKLETGF